MTTNNLLGVEEGYANLSNYVEDILLYKDRTISQWLDELKLPAVPDNVDRVEMHRLNQISVKLIDLVYTHCGISKALYITAKSAYNKKYNQQLSKIREDFAKNNDNNKKRLTNDNLENLAVSACFSEASTLAVAEFFFEFWKSQVDKVEAFNTRLTSLNISKHNEEKYTNNSF